MRRPESGNITGVHAVAAVEAQKVGHSCAIETGPLGLRILSHIDVRSHDLTVGGDVITKFTRNMILVLLNHVIMARRRIKASFAGGNAAYSHQPFAPVEIGALFGNVHHNLRATRNVITVPITASGGPAR